MQVGRFQTNSSSKYEIKIENEYYVNQNYLGDNPNFVLSNRMLYQKFKSYLWQYKGKETQDLALVCEPDDVGIDRDYMSPEYPLCSRSWLLYYGRRYDTNTYKYKNEMLLLPQYNQPKTVHLNPNDTGYYKAEYFYYHNNNFIIYHRQAYGQDHVGIEIYLRNGDYHQTIKLKIEGCYDHSYARLYLSSNGQYIFYCEAVKIEPDNPNNYETKTVGKIVELKYDAKTLEFKFETKRTIEDFKERYNKQAGEINTYNYYYGNGMEYDFFVTDNQELLFFDKTNGKIMYEEMD